jgi:hypothetical protein
LHGVARARSLWLARIEGAYVHFAAVDVSFVREEGKETVVGREPPLARVVVLAQPVDLFPFEPLLIVPNRHDDNDAGEGRQEFAIG